MYYASFSANNGTTEIRTPLEYTNKRSAIRDIKSLVRGNHFHQPYNSSKYMVWDEDGTIIASGYLNDNGWWSVNEYEIGRNINDEY